MKEIRETKLVEQTTVKFVANDGKEFIGEDAERECRNYERRCNEDLVEKEFNKLGVIPFLVPMMEYFSDDYKAWQIPLLCHKDYVAMVDYFEVLYGCSENYTEEPKEYPYTMTVFKGYDWFDEYKGNIKEDLQKVSEKLIK